MENYLPFISWVFFFGIFWLSKYHFELGPQSDRAIWLSPDALIWTFCWTNLSRSSALNRSSETFIYFLSLSVKSAVQIEPKWRATFRNCSKNSSLISSFLEKIKKLQLTFWIQKFIFFTCWSVDLYRFFRQDILSRTRISGLIWLVDKSYDQSFSKV